MSEHFIDWEVRNICKKCGQLEHSVEQICDGEQNEYNDVGIVEECWECECKRIRREMKKKYKIELEARRERMKKAIHEIIQNGK